jgi:hypothetical protein
MLFFRGAAREGESRRVGWTQKRRRMNGFHCLHVFLKQLSINVLFYTIIGQAIFFISRF